MTGLMRLLFDMASDAAEVERSRERARSLWAEAERLAKPPPTPVTDALTKAWFAFCEKPDSWGSVCVRMNRADIAAMNTERAARAFHFGRVEPIAGVGAYAHWFAPWGVVRVEPDDETPRGTIAKETA